ncbi:MULTISPECIES: hypothetical protein [Burkholderia]|uniref:Uncharacterized protein n=1 Tax=Burkholderia pseudomallei TaxID=28450 RepID=A0A0C5B4E3_BURPE|nr:MULTISPECIES: hypothetical protein [Burkholderia]AJL34896.1 hypothetical protein pBPS013 [Burkholderia pseudomallei]KWK68847.1 hypothetical protein WM15_06555 [Burkholderia ubonensis]
MIIFLPSPISDAIAVLDADVSEATSPLLDVLASIVHPDMVCSLFALSTLELELKHLAIRCIDYALVTGLTAEQSAELYRMIEPKIAARF